MSELTTAFNILSTLALFGALVFAGLQVRSANRFRAEQAALAIINTMHSEGYLRALSLILKIPSGVAANQIDALGPDVGRAIEDYGVRLETIGYMVFRGIVNIETVEQLIGGVVTVFWSRTRSWVERDRQRTSSPRQYEWVQWLSERLEQRHTGVSADPAYVKYRDWRLTW